jgi:nucleobase:cation symporter-1, NCS1 family
MQPWRLLESGERYLGWLTTLSGGMGTVAGVLIADYWIVRRKKLALEDLYLPSGVYAYRGGWNSRAVAATAIGCFLAWGGLAIPAMAPLVDYGWFVGAFGAAISYLVAYRWFPAKGHIEVLNPSA